MGALGFVAGIGYMILGLVQLAAVMAGLEEWVGMHWFFAVVLAFIIAYIPIVGAVVGMMGAMEAWHWEWWQAGGLFFGSLIVIGALFMIAGAADRIRGPQ